MNMEPALTPIPGLQTFEVPDTRGHDVVYGLAAGGGLVYLGVSNEFTPGVCAYVSAFDAATGTFRKVIDIAEAAGYRPDSGMMPHSKIHLSLHSTPGGRVFAATHFGIPVSTTHTITGAIVGVGATRRLSAVRWGVAGRIVWAWILTIPASAAVSAMTYLVISRLFS